MKTKPGGLIAVCVIAIVLGGLGMLTCLGTVAGFFMQSNMQAFAPQANGGAANDAAQKMQDKLNSLQLRWRPVQIVIVIFHTVIIAGLLVGGIMSLQLNPLGRKILMYAYLGAIPFDLARLVPTIVMQLQMIPIMKEMVNSMPQGNAGQAADATAAIATAGIVVGMVVAAGWFLIKLIIYIWGVLYLRKPEIVELFTPEDPYATIDPYSPQGFGR